MRILSPTFFVMGSSKGVKRGSKKGSTNLDAAALVYTGTNISLPSLLRWAVLPSPLLKRIATFRMVSAGGTLKKERILFMVKLYLLFPSEVACPAVVVPHV